MKKRIFILLVLLLCFTMSGCKKVKNEFVFEDYNDYSVVVKYEGTDADVIIPEEHNGLPVTRIGDGKNRLCSYGGMKNVTIPNSITTISSNAFHDESNLTSVTIPESVTSIGDSAFQNCMSLTNVILPNSLKNFGKNVFSYSNNLQYTTYDNGLYLGNTTNPYIVFMKVTNKSITTITVHQDTKFIHCNALRDCSSLTSVNIPRTLLSIGSYAFSECSSLVDITIPNTVTSIGEWAFTNCMSLTSMDLPLNITRIEFHTFYSCSNLSSITIPNSVKSIEDYAFAHCESLTSIFIPSNVAYIGEQAFINCKSVTLINVDSNNKVFDSRENCNALIETNTNTLLLGCINTKIPSTIRSIGNFAFECCRTLTSITIPDGVISIGTDAFNCCEKLSSISIPSSVKYIAENAFQYCSRLVIYCETSSQLSGWNAKWNPDNRPVYYGVNEEKFVELDSIQYILQDNIAMVTRYIGNKKSVTIPSKFTIGNNEYEVTGIGNYAFDDATNLESIYISPGIISIGDRVFCDCETLLKVVIPSSVTSMGNSVFYSSFDLEIYCGASSQPSGWSTEWNKNDYSVKWGYTE